MTFDFWGVWFWPVLTRTHIPYPISSLPEFWKTLFNKYRCLKLAPFDPWNVDKPSHWRVVRQIHTIFQKICAFSMPPSSPKKSPLGTTLVLPCSWTLLDRPRSRYRIMIMSRGTKMSNKIKNCNLLFMFFLFLCFEFMCFLEGIYIAIFRILGWYISWFVMRYLCLRWIMLDQTQKRCTSANLR